MEIKRGKYKNLYSLIIQLEKQSGRKRPSFSAYGIYKDEFILLIEIKKEIKLLQNSELNNILKMYFPNAILLRTNYLIPVVIGSVLIIAIGNIINEIIDGGIGLYIYIVLFIYILYTSGLEKRRADHFYLLQKFIREIKEELLKQESSV